jgi:hypothetical protein
MQFTLAGGNPAFITLPRVHSHLGEGQYQLRIWEGSSYDLGGTNRGHIDSGTAKAKLLITVFDPSREKLLEWARPLLEGKRHDIRQSQDKQSEYDVWF